MKIEKTIIIVLVILLISVVGFNIFILKPKVDTAKTEYRKIAEENNEPYAPANNTAFNNDNKGNAVFPTKTINRTPIAKFGEENIYQSDLEEALAKYKDQTDDIKKEILEEIYKNSVTLQEGQKQGLITLTDEIYNSPVKNYSKRGAAILETENKLKDKIITDKTDYIKGYVVRLFFHNDYPPPGWEKAGYEKSKEIAWSEISAIYNKVKNKEMSMEEAGEYIKNNPKYKDLDYNYTGNAITLYTKYKNKNYSAYPDFEDKLWVLTPGEISELYTAKCPNYGSKVMVDCFYMFGNVIDRHIIDSEYLTYDDWFNDISANYEKNIL